ncbi:unnamed protein product [Allacma fusca]|uniref:Uncharacterized protein n=1 Tax=Allacma fusca TaxID=39272 RepID=A0A8J2NZ91_9HEXA|nr:unnamed protein product [Allacma fusca]
MHEGFSDSNSSFFGYTTSLAQGSAGTNSGWVFVGAPKSNVPISRPGKSKGTYFEPGVIWRCNLGPIVQNCEILHFLDQYCKDRLTKNSDDFGECNSNFMGGSLVFDKNVLVACAPNWHRVRKGSNWGLRMDGACYWMKQDAALSPNLVAELANQKGSSQRGTLIPFQDAHYSKGETSTWSKNSGNFLRWYFGQSGFSVHVTNTSDIVLGAVGTHIGRGSMLKVLKSDYKSWGLTNLETFKKLPSKPRLFLLEREPGGLSQVPTAACLLLTFKLNWDSRGSKNLIHRLSLLHIQAKSVREYPRDSF